MNSALPSLRGIGSISQAVRTLILAVLFPAAAVAGGSYRYEIVAQTNSSLMGFHSEVSINDSGRVVFIGQETSDYTYFTGVWVADGGGTAPREVCSGCGSSFVACDYPQINNDGLVVYDYRASGDPAHFYILTVNPDTGDVTTVDKTFTVGYWSTSVQLPSISPNIPSAPDTVCVVYVEIDPTVAVGVDYNLMASYSPLGSGDDEPVVTSTTGWYTDRPKLANGGLVVARAGDNTTDSITLYQTAGSTITSTVVAGTPNFTSVGEAPGISDDGSIVAFCGVSNAGSAQIPGIFVSVVNAAGVPGTPIYVTPGLNSFSTDSPIGVTSPQGNPKWFTVVYIGTSNNATAMNSVTGIWSSVVHFPATAGGPYVVEPPVPVMSAYDPVYVDQNFVTHRALNFEIYDPVNNKGTVAFWVQTDAGDQVIIRATPLALGTDVSHYQGEVNWTMAYAEGIRFAYAKASDGVPPNSYYDIYFPNFLGMDGNAQAAPKAGLIFGAYHFAHPYKNSATEEAMTFLSVARSYIGLGYLPPALDIEEPKKGAKNVSNMPANALAEWISDWCNFVKHQTGVTPMIYTSLSFANELKPYALAVNGQSGFPLWFATDNREPTYRPSGLGSWGTNWLFMQYAGDGSAQSADWTETDASIDGDVFQGNLATLQVLAGTMPTSAPPVPCIQFWLVPGGQTVNIPATAILANAYSPNNGTLSVSLVDATSLQGGTVSLANGIISYTPPTGYAGLDHFGYTLSDGIATAKGDVLATNCFSRSMMTVAPGQNSTTAIVPNSSQAGATATLNNAAGTQPATVTLAAYSGNPDPGSVGGLGTTFVDLQVLGATAKVSMTAYFYYPLGIGTTTLQYDDISAGWAPVLSSGGQPPVLNTTPNLDGTTSGGRYTVVFDGASTPPITDLTGTVFALATVAPPVPEAITISAANNQAANLLVSDLLTNAVSLNGGTLSVTAVSPASMQGGTVTLAGGIITYTPPSGFTGSDEFEYTLSDGYATAQGTVMVTVGTAVIAAQNRLSITMNGTCANLGFQGTPGTSYFIQWAPSLTGPWTDFLPAITADAAGQISYTDCVYATARFYRAVSQ